MNVLEVEVLIGVEIYNVEDSKEVVKVLYKLGVKYVFMKGGYVEY